MRGRSSPSTCPATRWPRFGGQLCGGELGDGGLVPELEEHGAVWQSAVSWDSFVTGIDAPVDRLPDAVGLLAHAVRRPALDSDDVLRRRAQLVEQLRMEDAWAATLAARAVGPELFTGRYALPLTGDPDRLGVLTPEQVSGFHAERIADAPGTLVVVGDLGRIDVDALAARVFDGCGPRPAPISCRAAATDAPAPRIVVLDRPGAVQSALVFAHRAPARSRVDLPVIFSVGDVLGGMFTSRLNQELRERRGYTYGVASRFDLRRDGGVFTTSCQVATDDTADAVAVTIAQTQGLVADGPDDTELAAVRTHNTVGMPVNYATPQAIAEALIKIVAHDLPDDHVDRMRAGFESLTRERLHEGTRAYLFPGELVTIVAGDAERVRPELERAGLGPLRDRADPVLG